MEDDDPCSYCIRNPPKLEDPDKDSLDFLPCPVPSDEQQQYKKFEEVCTCIHDSPNQMSYIYVTSLKKF